MKTTYKTSEAISFLEELASVIPVKTANPILRNVCLEATANKLIFKATDLELSMMIAGNNISETAGKTTVSIMFLLSALKKIKQPDFQMEQKNNEIEITAARKKIKLVTLDPVDFPDVGEVGKLEKGEDGEGESITIDNNLLLKVIERTAYAIDPNDTRLQMQGLGVVPLENETLFCGTDGKRLAISRYPARLLNEPIIIPYKSVMALKKSLKDIGAIKVKVGNGRIAFGNDDFGLTTLLIDAVFPNVLQVIPKKFEHILKINRKEFLKALDFATVVLPKDKSAVKLILEDGKIVVDAETSEIGNTHVDIDVEYSGEKIVMIVNPYYFMAAMGAVDDEIIKLKINSGTMPVVFEGENYTAIVMPLRA